MHGTGRRHAEQYELGLSTKDYTAHLLNIICYLYVVMKIRNQMLNLQRIGNTNGCMSIFYNRDHLASHPITRLAHVYVTLMPKRPQPSVVGGQVYTMVSDDSNFY